MTEIVTGNELTALIKRAMRGDTHSFERLVSNFSEDIIYNLLTHLDEGCKADVEDAAQEVVLVLHRNISSLKSPRAFYAYLRTVIFNMARRYNLRAKRTRTEDVDEHEQAGHLRIPASEQPETEFERKQTIALLEGYMNQLPERQRETLYLYYYRDLSYTEIAQRQGVTTSTVGTNISKAKGALKKMLENGNNDLQGREDLTAQPRAKEDPGPQTLAGFAAAPLIHDTIEHTINQYAVQNSAKHLASQVGNIIGSHPEAAVAAGAAVTAVPGILKAAAALLIAGTVATGSYYGMQEASVQMNMQSETSTVTTIQTYSPNAHVVFEGGQTTAPTVDTPDIDTGQTGEDAPDEQTQAGSSEEYTPVGEHVNPATASVVLDEGTPGYWRVMPVGTETTVLEGTQPPANLAGLSPGEYTIIFDLTSPDGTITAYVQRSFVVY